MKFFSGYFSYGTYLPLFLVGVCVSSWQQNEARPQVCVLSHSLHWPLGSVYAAHGLLSHMHRVVTDPA